MKMCNRRMVITHRCTTVIDKLTYEEVIHALHTALKKEGQRFDQHRYQIRYRNRSQKLVLVRDSFPRNIQPSWRRLCVAYFEVDNME